MKESKLKYQEFDINFFEIEEEIKDCVSFDEKSLEIWYIYIYSDFELSLIPKIKIRIR